MPLRSLAARLAALLLAALVATPALAGEFTDSAGRRLILPDHINRAMAANMSAEVLVFVLAPDKLIGWVQTPSGALPKNARHLPVIGPIADPGAAAAITRLKPDVIIDVGEVTPDRAAFADQVTQATGTPYVLLDGSFDRMATMLRVAGRLLGVADRGDDLSGSAEHAINALRGQLLINSAVNRPRVYYGRGANGLEPAQPGSPAAAAIEDAGAINVAALPGAGASVAITRHQLQEWNPDIIIAETPAFYRALLHDPGWRTLAAVRNKHFYLEPAPAFGWIDDPSWGQPADWALLAVGTALPERQPDRRALAGAGFLRQVLWRQTDRPADRRDRQDRRHSAKRHAAPCRSVAQRHRDSGRQRTAGARRPDAATPDDAVLFDAEVTPSSRHFGWWT